MVNLIIGKKGTGKTKRLIKLAQDALLQASGQVIFIDDDKRCMPELNYNIRFINTTEFSIRSADDLYGFLAGMIAANFDTQKIFIDGLLNITNLSISSLKVFADRLNELCCIHDIDIYIIVSAVSSELPEGIEKYIFEELKTQN